MIFIKYALACSIALVLAIGVQSQSAAQNNQLERGLAESAKKFDDERRKEALDEFERKMEGRPKSNKTVDSVASGIHNFFIGLIVLLVGAGVVLAIKGFAKETSDSKKARELLTTFKSKVELIPESTPFVTRRKKSILNKIENALREGKSLDYNIGQYTNISTRTIKYFISRHDSRLQTVTVDEKNYEKKIKSIAKNFSKLNDLYDKATDAKIAGDEDSFVDILKKIITSGKPVFEETLAGINIEENLDDLTQRAGYSKDIKDIIYDLDRGYGVDGYLQIYLQKLFKNWKARNQGK